MLPMIIENPGLMPAMVATLASVRADPACTDANTGLYVRKHLAVEGQDLTVAELLPPDQIDWTGHAVDAMRRALVAAGYGPQGLLIALAALPDGSHHAVLTADVSTPAAAVTHVLDTRSAAVLLWEDLPAIQYRECADGQSWALVNPMPADASTGAA
jgi:hypothetical protein